MLAENEITFPAYRRYQDPPFFVRAMAEAGDFFVTEVPFYCYRVTNHSVILDNRKLCDGLLGIIDVLEISREKKLKELHRRTYYRINEIMGNMFLDSILNGNVELLELLIRANDRIQWKWVEERCKVEKPLLKPLYFLIESAKTEMKRIRANSKKWDVPCRFYHDAGAVVLYGAGTVGRCYFDQMKEDKNCFIKAWVDENYERYSDSSYVIESPQILKEIVFDYVIIAVADMQMAMDIMENLTEMGVPGNKVIWSIELNL